MEKELFTINELLKAMNIAPISEATAKEWLIVGGESFEEINEMAKCYAGTVEEKKIENDYYKNTCR